MSDDLMQGLRNDRSLPPPDHWPDGRENAVYRFDLRCALRQVVADLPAHRVSMVLPEFHAVDMSGAVGLALDIDPHVREVQVFVGTLLDIVYLRGLAGEWRCIDEDARRAHAERRACSVPRDTL